MKMKFALPFALTALVAALSGCGGESANVIPENYDTSSANGSCTSGSEKCIEFVLDYPLDGLNFTCSTDSKNKFVTIFDPSEGVATGTCRIGDTVTFYLQGEKTNKIELGQVNLNDFSKVASSNTPPRLTLIDLAQGMTRSAPQSVDAADKTIQTAMRLVQMVQAIGMTNNQLASAAEIQPVYIKDANRTALDKLDGSVTVSQFTAYTDSEFSAFLQEWLGAAPISSTQAFSIVKQLLTLASAAVYQPEFALFSTAQSTVTKITGSNGLVGCDDTECLTSNTAKTNLFGYFMLMTDRQGMTFGSGLQWRGKLDQSLETIGATNALLMTKVKPKMMTAAPQDTWIDPLTKRIDEARKFGFKFDVNETGAGPLTITQGTLLANKMVLGSGNSLYQTLTDKLESEVGPADQANYGLWNQTVNGTLYQGTLDLYKLFPISYLDKTVFRTQGSSDTSTYIFPLYADLTFKFTDTAVKTVKLGIVIDRNGDIRTNIRPNVPADIFNTSANIVDLSTDDNGCSGADVLDKLLMKDDFNTQQYRIGTVTRTFTSGSKVTPNSISVRMILADEALGTLNGALIGMNTTVKTSTDNTENVVIGGALVRMDSLLTAAAGARPTTVTFTDSAGSKVKWGNSFASFNRTYNNSYPSDAESKEFAKLSGGEISLDLAPCYSIQNR